MTALFYSWKFKYDAEWVDINTSPATRRHIPEDVRFQQHQCVNMKFYILVLFYLAFIPYLLTHSMEQSPSWEANRFSVSQEIPCILWNPKVHYRSDKCPPPRPILSQLDPVHTLTFYFLKIHLNINLPSTPGFPKWSLSLRFHHQNPVYASPLPHTRYMPLLISFLSILSPEQYWVI